MLGDKQIGRHAAVRSCRRALLVCWLGVAAFAALSCKSVAQIDPALGVVFGTVTDPVGTAVSGATISVSAVGPDCSGSVPFATAQTSTTAGGDYRVLLRAVPVGQMSACVRVSATPSPGSGLKAEDSTGATLVFHSPNLAPTDSVRVDLRLQR